MEGNLPVRRPRLSAAMLLTIAALSLWWSAAAGADGWPVPNWEVAADPASVGLSAQGLDEYRTWLAARAGGKPYQEGRAER